jgi:hypothetical protein
MSPWLFDPNLDTPESWRFFIAYRDATVRKLGVIRYSAWDKFGARPDVPTMEQLRQWYTHGRWKDRAVAYDAHMDEVAQEQREITVRQTAEEAAEGQKEVLQMAMAVLQREFAKLLADTELEHKQLRPADLVRLGDFAIKAQRLIHGETTEKVETVDYSSLSEQDFAELRRLAELTRKK